MYRLIIPDYSVLFIGNTFYSECIHQKYSAIKLCNLFIYLSENVKKKKFNFLNFN